MKAQLSIETHFLHTTGAKLFSSFTGHPTDRVLSDADESLYEIQKGAKSPFPPMETVNLLNEYHMVPLLTSDRLSVRITR